jgi:prolyl oligopeptidase
VIRKKEQKLDSSTPTLLYGYGGFQHSMSPFYLETPAKLWISRGGAYVLANIRGGGEYGPAWHQAALKSSRHKAFEDFEAVAEDVSKWGLTNPAKLAISGGSNGGLLVGAVATRRPELMSAVICSVPLLDMLRYHELLAGASWIGEYGDPRLPEFQSYWQKFSPYQNVETAKKYPSIFFMTSTKDDRVHPGHARKMYAKMKAQSHDVYYYENVEGGHSAASNRKQMAYSQALSYSFLFEKLFKDVN